MNVHFHCVVPDGVWVREEGTVRFVPLPGLTDDDVAQVLRRLESRVRALPRPRLDALREDARPADALAASQAESVSVLRGKPPDPCEAKHLAAYHQGFSLHAGVHLHANDREGLAHLCGYGARPPLRQERHSALPDGKLAYRMKRPLGEGRAVLILEPRELLRRLATLIPPPRAHLVRYHGVFGPASKWPGRSYLRPRSVRALQTHHVRAARPGHPAPRPGPSLLVPSMKRAAPSRLPRKHSRLSMGRTPQGHRFHRRETGDRADPRPPLPEGDDLGIFRLIMRSFRDLAIAAGDIRAGRFR